MNPTGVTTGAPEIGAAIAKQQREAERREAERREAERREAEEYARRLPALRARAVAAGRVADLVAWPAKQEAKRVARRPRAVVTLTANGLTVASPVIGNIIGAPPSGDLVAAATEARFRQLERLALVYLDMGMTPVAYGPWGERIITRKNVARVYRKPATAAELRNVARKQHDGGQS
jgi:hypothetical protein